MFECQNYSILNKTKFDEIAKKESLKIRKLKENFTTFIWFCSILKLILLIGSSECSNIESN